MKPRAIEIKNRGYFFAEDIPDNNQETFTIFELTGLYDGIELSDGSLIHANTLIVEALPKDNVTITINHKAENFSDIDAAIKYLDKLKGERQWK